MIGDDDKKTALLILGKNKPEAGPMEESEEDSPDTGLKAAAQEVMAAFESKDVDALNRALINHHSLYQTDYVPDDDEE